MISVVEIAAAVRAAGLKCSVTRESVLLHPPWHSKGPFELSVSPSATDKEGFVVHSFANDDPLQCREFMRGILKLSPWKPKSNGHALRPSLTAGTIKRAAILAAQARAAAAASSATPVPKVPAPAPVAAPAPSVPPAPESAPRVTATYPYRDASGALLYEVQRLDPKSFRQRRPVDGGYVYSLGDVKPVLYLLPELLAFPDATTFFCEGEKDVDRLHALDMVATTISGSTTWTPELAEPLRNRDVIILVDADVPGAAKAEKAALALHGVAASIRLVLLPDLPPGGDVSDFLDAGNSKAQLEQVCLSAPLWQPQTEQSTAVDGDAADGVTLDDFIALLPMHAYVFIPSREMWPAVSVNAKVPPVEVGGKKIRPTDWLDAHRCAVQLTWLPGAPLEIRDRIIADGGWVERNGVTCLNTYRPPTIVPGNAAAADRWIDHCHKVYPNDADRLIRWCAHRVQRPQQKCNHALFLGGAPGIGKDTLLEPLKHAVGPWNFQEVAPKTLLGQFNGYAKAVVLRISEARDLGDTNRFSFYDTSKVYCAAPPDVLRVNEKHLREHYVPNCCGVIFTSNYRTDGLYLPADDRRHDVMWSDCTAADFSDGYWIDLWDWYRHGGFESVAAYLQELDISDFDPAAPPPKTAAFWAIVDAGAAPEDAEVADVLDRLGNPPAVTLAQIKAAAVGDIFEWLIDRRNRRAIPHRLEKCGYIIVRNNDTKQGLWIIQETRQAIYAKAELSVRERYLAATELVRKGGSKH